ncbi:MAG: HepT-like ribonuclease domain-containing protein [Deltaproteobacteria bacterium]
MSDWGARATLCAVIGLRNVLVHEYVEVDLAIVRDVVEHRLGDLEAFVASISGRNP